MNILKKHNGFTLAELVMALMVTAIVLAAVGSLAYAMTSANASSGDTSFKQSYIRSAAIRLTELVRNAKLICGTPDNAIVIWKADTNSDKKINSDELVYVQTNAAGNQIRLIQYDPIAGTVFSISDIQSGAAISTLAPYQQQPIDLIPQCSNVVFTVDNPGTPKSKFAVIKFSLPENNVASTHEISIAVASPAFNLLNSSNEILSSDDD